MTYTFVFDASACSGCKACQVACKDKNNLPTGVLWRRVYEITGGSWQKFGDAWVTDVFAYNLSIACNHCVHPKCAGVCPTDAYVVREDGIVYIDESMCIGCGYCNWACPYAAPQYDPERGKVAKCNFCFDQIDAGLPPACVAACPLRVLDYIEVNSDQSSVTSLHLWEMPAKEHPFPLPNFSRTEPHLEIQPHAGMVNTLEKTISNREEIHPGKTKSELPLVAFTLLGQMAAGMALIQLFSGPFPLPVLISIGSLIVLAGLASLFHLGAPLNAWRGIVHLKKSWLSREVLMFVLFGASWLIAMAMPGMGKLPLAICGIGLVFCMAQVYRLRSIATWNSNHTLLAFPASSILLGGIGLKIVELLSKARIISNLPFVLIVAIGLVIALSASFWDRDHIFQSARRLRFGLIGLGIAGLLGILFIPEPTWGWVMIPTCLIFLFEEGIGRWLFYEHLHQRSL